MGTENFYKNEGSLKLIEKCCKFETSGRMEDT